jgi:thiopeptide-type bacteriocin biosynthesis protein
MKLFGAGDRATRVLMTIAPAIRAARARGECERWFFLPYVDGPGRREHLRVRFRGGTHALVSALDQACEQARASGDLIAVESAQWFPERARFGDDALDAVEQIFESDSELICALHERDGDDDETESLVQSFDALAAGCGLSREDRRALARRRRDAYAVERDQWRDEFRTRQKRLIALLSTEQEPFAAHRARVAAAKLPRTAELLPILLHLAAVRLCGPDREAELRGYYFWERGLESTLRKR